MIFGYLLIIVGLYFLLKNLGVLTAEVWEIIFPSLIIIFGLAIIYKKKKGKNDLINIE